ncbi:TniQ family protein [Vibrio alginolyticus]|uniref:TniQ family protein n=1 Tax=Vibrio alginolyticus TaxID=663 RepID=UPI003F67E53C
MTKIFPVRYRPKEHESFRGYILRIAWHNGYDSLHTLHRIIGEHYRTHYDGNISSITKALSAAINLDQSALEAYFNFELDFAVDSARAIADIRYQGARICPYCIQEKVLIDESWQLAHNTHCSTHNVALINTCPGCGDELTWSPELFDGCTNQKCEFRWTSFSFLPTEIPDFQLAESLLIGHEKKEFLQQLYQAFVYTMRPFDCMYDNYKTLPSGIDNLQSRFSVAYTLLRSNEFREDWLLRRRNFLEKSSHAINNICINAIQPVINSIQGKDWLPEANGCEYIDCLETHKAIPEARYQRLNSIGEARFQLKISDVSNILEISKSAVIYLAKQGMIPAEKSSKYDCTYLFDFRDVMAFIASFTERAQPINQPTPDMLNMEYVKKKSCYFDVADTLAEGIIFEALADSSLQLFVIADSRWKLSDLYFNQEQIFERLEGIFALSFQDVYPKTKMRKICGFNEAQYYAFRDVFYEKLVLKKNQHRYIAPETLKNFFEENVLLNRWSMLRNLDVSEVLTKLNNSSISYSYPSLLKDGIFIIPKSKSHLL